MYDIANYLNEWCCDNAYPKGSGIDYQLCNWPTEQEIVNTTRLYWLMDQGESAVWDLATQECAQAVDSVKRCMILNNFYWAVWAIVMLSEADETNPKAFQWDFFEGRCQMQQLCIEKFGMGQI